MAEELAQTQPEPTEGLSLHEVDQQVVIYLNARAKALREAPEKWALADLTDKRWMIGEVILREGNASDRLIEARLWYADLSLADFMPNMYNETQVARDSDDQLICAK